MGHMWCHSTVDSPVAIRDSNGDRPVIGDWPGATAHTGWDPGGTFLLVDVSGSELPRFKYRPDGSGDLDLPAGTEAAQGWSAQCLPEECLTSLTVFKRVDGANGTYPATFHYTGTVPGDIVIDDAPLSYEGSISAKVQPGHASVTEAPNADWPLTSIECDAPATVDLGAGTASLDIPLGTAVTCSFLSDIGVPVYTPYPVTTTAPSPGIASPGASACPDGAYTTGTAVVVASGHRDEFLSFSMGVPWCHDGRRATIPRGDGSVGLVTGQQGLENDARFLALSGLFGLQIEESPIDTYAYSSPQPDGSLIVEGRTEFRATLDGVQIALALVPELGLEGKVLQQLQQTFLRVPVIARPALVNQLAGRLAGRLLSALEHVGLDRHDRINELPKLAKAVASALLQGAGSVVGGAVPSITIGVSTWSPVYRFHLYPDGTATHSLSGDHGGYWTPVDVAGEFKNHP